MLRWIKRLFYIAVALQLLYLVAANIALNQPGAQKLISQLKPDKISVEWSSLRSYFPTHFEIENIRASGETARKSWEATAKSVSIRINWFAAANRIVHVTDASIFDLQLTIGDRAATSKKKALRSNRWRFKADNVSTHGHHRIELPPGKGEFDGRVDATVNYSAETKELSLLDGRMDARLGRIYHGNKRILKEGGKVSGTFGLGPFKPTRHRGKAILKFLKVESRLSVAADNLAFLNVYFQRARGMQLTGAGSLDGHIHFDRGFLKAPTMLRVGATPLLLDMPRLQLNGAGNIDIAITDSSNESLHAIVEFDELEGSDTKSGDLLALGSSLRLEVQVPNISLLEKPDGVPEGTLTLSIPKMHVPDLQVYQSFIPDTLPFLLKGGEGTIDGTITLNQDNAAANLHLVASNASLELHQYAIKSGLDVSLAVSVPSFSAPSVDISGSSFSLTNATLDAAEEAESMQTDDPDQPLPPFSMGLIVTRGSATLPVTMPDSSGNRLEATVRQAQTAAIFKEGELDLALKGSVSDLRWIEQFFRNQNGLAIRGSGEVHAQIKTKNGAIGTGSRIQVIPNKLAASFLDYEINGTGEVTLDIKRGGLTPDIVFTVIFDTGAMKRQTDAAEFASVSNVKLTARAQQVNLKSPIDNIELRVEIPTAKVLDMTVYNRFLPPTSPLQLVSGIATLSADIQLSKEMAEGQLKLETQDLSTTLDKQLIAARLKMAVEIQSGNPGQMQFDISGSNLSIDQISVTGEGAEPQQWREGKWLGRLALKNSHVRWRTPIEVDLKADLYLDDTRPFVAVLSNHSGRREWLENLMSVDNVQGLGEMTLRENKLHFPLIFVDAGVVKNGCKGIDRWRCQGGSYICPLQETETAYCESKTRERDSI